MMRAYMDTCVFPKMVTREGGDACRNGGGVILARLNINGAGGSNFQLSKVSFPSGEDTT